MAASAYRIVCTTVDLVEVVKKMASLEVADDGVELRVTPPFLDSVSLVHSKDQSRIPPTLQFCVYSIGTRPWCLKLLYANKNAVGTAMLNLPNFGLRSTWRFGDLVRKCATAYC